VSSCPVVPVAQWDRFIVPGALSQALAITQVMYFRWRIRVALVTADNAAEIGNRAQISHGCMPVVVWAPRQCWRVQ